MASPAPNSTLSLAQYIPALYPLARVLVGSDEAVSLIRTVYEHAADVAPGDRPDDEREWLIRLLVEARDGTLPSDRTEASPQNEPSFTDDPFRREVAERTAERVLPAAFASCSIHERFILAVDVLANPSDESLADALDTSITDARSLRDRARSALRASLRDVLNGPERMLVDVALADDALRDQLRTLLTVQFDSPPSSLRSDVTEILEAARAERHSDASTDSQSASNPSLLQKARSTLHRILSVRGLVGLLLVSVLVAAGVGGASYVFSTGPSPSSTSVVDLSVRQTENVQLTATTSVPSEAAQYIRQTWDRRLSVPSIQGSTLRGVGQLSLSGEMSVPVLVYTDDESGEQIIAYAFNYNLLDQLNERVVLDHELRTKLAANDEFLDREHPDRGVILWRQRDDIFVVVAPPSTDANTLRSRIRL